MAEVNYVLEALKFMVLGMGVVFLFLIILVKAIELQAYLINKYFPEEEIKPPTMPTPVASSSDEEESARVAAIIAAVSEFRKNKS
jgi:oxaloacetate decarboxylase gamma subunit